MKKLLSAVTSAVMSASLVSGAFTSSVSAAGSFAAAQPNVSMGGVLDVAANKTAGEDVVFDFGNYNANAGSSVIVNVKVDTQGKAVSAVIWVLTSSHLIQRVSRWYLTAKLYSSSLLISLLTLLQVIIMLASVTSVKYIRATMVQSIQHHILMVLSL